MYIYKDRRNLLVNLCMYIYTKCKHTNISNFHYMTLIDSYNSRMLPAKCMHARTLHAMQHTATLQHCITTHCNTLQHTATSYMEIAGMPARYTYCNTLQHCITTYCNTLQQTETHCNALQHNRKVHLYESIGLKHM